jgi:hypothetical protein
LSPRPGQRGMGYVELALINALEALELQAHRIAFDADDIGPYNGTLVETVEASGVMVGASVDTKQKPQLSHAGVEGSAPFSFKPGWAPLPVKYLSREKAGRDDAPQHRFRHMIIFTKKILTERQRPA